MQLTLKQSQIDAVLPFFLSLRPVIRFLVLIALLVHWEKTFNVLLKIIVQVIIQSLSWCRVKEEGEVYYKITLKALIVACSFPFTKE